MANSPVSSLMFTAGAVSTKVPMSRSSVKLTVPLPTVRTSIVDGPYTANPAATWFDPGCKKLASVTGAPAAGQGSTEKIVPIDTFTSILDEPSSGSTSSR